MSKIGAQYSRSNLFTLTPSEAKFLEALASGASVTLAAERLGIRRKSADARAAVIREKLHVATNAQAVKTFFKGAAA